MDRANRYYAALSWGAYGDALGMICEGKSSAVLYRQNSGPVTALSAIPADSVNAGSPRGSLSDFFTLLTAMLQQMAADGSWGVEQAKAGALRWSKNVRYATQREPITQRGIKLLSGQQLPLTKQDRVACFNRSATSGGCAAGLAVALCHPGDSRLVDDIITAAQSTHPNLLSVTGAAAVGSALSAALATGSRLAAIQHGLAAAQNGYRQALGRLGQTVGCERLRPTAGPSLYRRIQLAVQLGNDCRGDLDRAVQQLGDYIGATQQVVDAVPAVFGCLCAATNARQAVQIAANLGDDSPTIAAITGLLAGAVWPQALPDTDSLTYIERENALDLLPLAEQLAHLAPLGPKEEI
ncbi:ADP-ribosylglycohydrolase family protein [Neobittarella massiliensis]|uniref:ADP-ribosylglycohydrolase family protein n=1 Tax=Neobittarella massiliensis (ex Bilen et al. 2018) TaxID=2041842 RepID=A0A8J6IPF7_9FIRM|nr:ADP-ribosylglycohydrolase family protein [Neobittarella massiliensis]MBC3516612.1 ADP-ribosylglycohydrolase family protein [Neobittarella massiliensis]